MAYSKFELTTADTVYMLMTDRFFDGDPSNNGMLGVEYQPGNLHFYQGGDWKGLMQKLPYIKQMGFTAIWMSAPQDNELFSRTGDEAGYHGYYTRDFNQPNPHFGTSEDLQALLDKAEGLGLKVIIDAQLNHTADYLEYPSEQYDPPEYRPAPPFDNPTWYHNTPNIINFADPYEAQNYSLGGLDDLAQENPDCWKALMDAYWQEKENRGWFSYGFAGSRVDAVVEIPPEYLAKYEKHTGKHSFGEAFTGSVVENSAIQQYLWGMLDYPLYFQINNTICRKEDWSGIKWVFDQDALYRNPHQLFTFVDNHDRSRFLANCGGQISKLHLALAFIYAARGIPVIYYGTEQEMAGDYRYTDQTINLHNREMMTCFSDDGRTFAMIQRLNQIRKKYKDILSSGKQTEIFFKDGDSVYAFQRKSYSDSRRVICIFNSSPVEQSRTFLLNQKVCGSYTDLLNTQHCYDVCAGQLDIIIPGNCAMILAENVEELYIPMEIKSTKIVIHYDAGWGNALYIRGEKIPLNWEQGHRCDNANADVWIFEIDKPFTGPLPFKVLINDLIWETGMNHSVCSGTTCEIWPKF